MKKIVGDVRRTIEDARAQTVVALGYGGIHPGRVDDALRCFEAEAQPDGRVEISARDPWSGDEMGSTPDLDLSQLVEKVREQSPHWFLPRGGRRCECGAGRAKDDTRHSDWCPLT